MNLKPLICDRKFKKAIPSLYTHKKVVRHVRKKMFSFNIANVHELCMSCNTRSLTCMEKVFIGKWKFYLFCMSDKMIQNQNPNPI